MKYGETLQQRSIPEWGIYNVDYNEIKQLIKLRTSNATGQAIPVPGQKNDNKALEDFEKELYAELLDQHQRIDLFVRSKSGEIKRRLDHLNRQLIQLEAQSQLASKKRISVRRLEKFSKVEGEVLNAGEEIQSLARYVGAQRTAFLKLLKKYKKWTGSSALGARFQNEVLGQPRNFAQKDFSPLLAQWADLLAAVRAPFEAGLSWKANNTNGTTGGRLPSIPQSSQSGNLTEELHDEHRENKENEQGPPSAHELYTSFTTGSDVDVDTALATIPLGKTAGRAAYWIHPENLIQLHVVLLQYSRLRRRNAEVSSPTSPVSPSSSRRGSVRGSFEGRLLGTEEEVGTIVCDDPNSFAKRRNNATISEIETLQGTVACAAAASFRYSSSGEAIVSVESLTNTPNTSDVPSNPTMKTAKMKRKVLAQLFDREDVTASRSQSLSGLKESKSFDQDFFTVRQWLHDHLDIQPLVHIRSKRTRFVGLGNNEVHGTWAVLDKDILTNKSSLDDLDNLTNSPVSDTGITELFPHAVLEVRWEGESQPELVKALDESHLTERVRGFSLETHAVATLCRPSGMPTPFWLPAINKDIRKLPSSAPLSRRQSNPRRSSDSASIHLTSTSTNSVADQPSSSGFSAPLPLSSPATSIPEQHQSSHLKAFKKKRRPRKPHPLRAEALDNPTSQQRYWNEFDDGDEAPPDEAYTIFVDPNASSTFPGAAIVSNAITALRTRAHATSEKLTAWFQPSTRPESQSDRQTLVTDYFPHHHPATDPALDSDADSDSSTFPRHYATFPRRRARSSSSSRQARAARETLLLHCCIGSFVASFALLVLASMLEITSRRRYAVTADVGEVVGVVGSLLFAVVGMALMVARGGRSAWKVGVVVLFVVAVGGNGVVVFGMVGGWRGLGLWEGIV